jgi:hypothetical protein
MTDVRAELERLAPLPDARLQDWGDVLRRARGARRRRATLVAAAAIVVAGALLIAAPALGLRPGIFGEEPTPSWTWPDGIPGEPIQAPKILRDFNDELHGKWLRNRVDIDTTRLILTVGSGSERQSELAAQGSAGGVCIAIVGGELDSPGMTGGFGCLDTSAAGRAVFVHEAGGGHRGSVVDYTTITGVARADVGRVELELVDGKTIELPLNRWRGFGYYTTDPKRFPVTLRAYQTWSSLFGHHEKLVGQLPLQEVNGLTPTPLCGGKYGPCPPGVKP